jgi:hypothetical protein
MVCNLCLFLTGVKSGGKVGVSIKGYCDEGQLTQFQQMNEDISSHS